MKYEFLDKIDPNGSHGKLLAQVKPGSTVLECGCAGGYMTKVMKEQLGCSVYIVEYDQNGFENALQFAEDGICADLMRDEWVEKFADVPFDYIVFADVLEHLVDPLKVLKAAVSMLKQDGTMLVSIPNVGHNDVVAKLLSGNWDYTSLGLLDDTHVHFWGIHNLDTFFRAAGLTITIKDCTLVATECTEQYGGKDYPDNENFRAAVKDRIDGEVYQFILTLRKNEYFYKARLESIDLIGSRGISELECETIQSMRQKVSERDAQISKLTDITEANQKEIAILEEKCQVGKEALKRAEGRCKELRLETIGYAEDVTYMRKEIDCWNTKYQRVEAERSALNREIRELQGELNSYKHQLQKIENAFANCEGECQQLRDKENRFLHELREKDAYIDSIKHTRTWRVGRFFANIARAIVPAKSKRAVIVRLLVTMIKFPGKFFRSLTPKKLKTFFRLLRKGNISKIQRAIQDAVYGPAPQIAPPALEIVKPDVVAVDPQPLREKTEADYAPLHVPQWEEPQVSIVIPVYNQFDYTYHCVESILKNSREITYEIIIGNDCSTDLTTRIDKIITGITCINNETNLRFVRNCNNAAKYARGKYILFLNNDTQVQENWLEPLVTLIESADDIGMVGSKLIYPDGLLQEAGGIVWKDGSAWNYGNRQNPELPQFNYVKEVDYISGASIMIHRWLWEKIGGFDELFAPAYCDDSDLAFTVRSLGYRVMYQPLSVVVHYEGVSNGTDTSSGQKQYQIENSKKLHQKWADEFAKHPDNAVNVFQARDRSYDRKTLLMVDHYVPHFDKDAGSRTVYQYLKLFVSLGFNVKFIGDNFFRHEPYTTALQQMGIEVLYGPEAAQHWQDWILENAEHFDYVFLNRPHIAPRYLDFIRQHTNAKIMYYGHDLAFLRGMREYEITGNDAFLQEAMVWKPKELDLMRRADMAYYPSYVEVDEIHKIDPSISVKAIPAYLFEDVDWEGYNFQERKDIMFIGGFGHRPNVDAVKWVASEVLPLLLQKLPDIKIHILGSNAPQEILGLASKHLIIEGFVTDEQLAEFYHNCRIALVPLRYGAGIKGKVIEAMRFGTPVVTTPTGAEGIPNSENVLAVEESAEALANQIAELYNDEEKLTQMSRNSIAYIQENYSPNNAIKVIAPEFDLC